MSSAAPEAAERGEALAAAHARLEAWRSGEPLRREKEEREYARRSVLYVVLSAVLLGHLALAATRLPEELRIASGAVLPVGYGLWRRARLQSPERGRRSAWAGWAVSCIVATAGIVVSRHALFLEVALPAGLYGLGTFALGCAFAADGRRFEGCAALRWLTVLVLVVVLLGLHQELLQTSWGGDDG